MSIQRSFRIVPPLYVSAQAYWDQERPREIMPDDVWEGRVAMPDEGDVLQAVFDAIEIDPHEPINILAADPGSVEARFCALVDGVQAWTHVYYFDADRGAETCIGMSTTEPRVSIHDGDADVMICDESPTVAATVALAAMKMKMEAA